MDDSRRCTARSKRSGNRCKRAAVRGGTVCSMHGGKAPQVAAAARHRAAQFEAHAEAERMLARAGVDADPVEHLLDSLYRAAALVEVWGRMVADLDNASEVDLRDQTGRLRGEQWWEKVEVGIDAEGNPKYKAIPKADRLLATTNEGRVHTHPFVDEYHRALDRRAKYAKLAIDAGVAERQVQLAEDQATMVVAIYEAALAEIAERRGFDVDQNDRTVIARHLRALPGGAA